MRVLACGGGVNDHIMFWKESIQLLCFGDMPFHYFFIEETELALENYLKIQILIDTFMPIQIIFIAIVCGTFL
jgi:hypothetical protein